MTDISNPDTARGTGPGGLIGLLVRLHNGVFSVVDRVFAGWFNGFAARFAFASLLLLYYLNSGLTKLGDGIFGFLNPTLGAYASILPSLMEEYGFESSAIPFFPWHIIVYLGTWSEFLLPILIVVGLFSRIAAAGMIVFIIVQSYVDVAFHGLDAKFVGSMFDRLPDAIIFDQRMLWVFVLLMIVVNGPGKLSLDHLLARRYR